MPPGRGFGVVPVRRRHTGTFSWPRIYSRKTRKSAGATNDVAPCGGVPAPELTRMMLFPNTSEEPDPDDLAQPLCMP